MPNKRKVIFTKGEIYHIYNRSIANQEIFFEKKELSRALNLVGYYRFPQTMKYSRFRQLNNGAREEYLNQTKKLTPFIEIYSYTFMPEHFHFLLKEVTDNGLVSFVSDFQNAYAKYFNKKNNRDGGLFQSPFKAKWIENDEILMHVSRYIHLNPVTSNIITINELATYPWSSYHEYISGKESNLVETELLVKLCGSLSNYQKFITNQIDYQKKLHLIKRLINE